MEIPGRGGQRCQDSDVFIFNFEKISQIIVMKHQDGVVNVVAVLLLLILKRFHTLFWYSEC